MTLEAAILDRLQAETCTLQRLAALLPAHRGEASLQTIDDTARRMIAAGVLTTFGCTPGHPHSGACRVGVPS